MTIAKHSTVKNKIEGATDGTEIGNVSDRLKVDANFTTPPSVDQREFQTFVAYAVDVAVNTNKSMFSLLNASGSTVVVKIREIRLINSSGTSLFTGAVGDFRLLKCTGHSAGTLVTPVAHDSTDSLNGSITARTGATIAGEDAAAILSRQEWSTDEWSGGAADVESLDHAFQALIPSWVQQDKCKAITLRANEGVTFKQVATVTTGNFDVMVLFTQE